MWTVGMFQHPSRWKSIAVVVLCTSMFANVQAQNVTEPVIQIQEFDFESVAVVWTSAGSDSSASLDIRWKTAAALEWTAGIEVPITQMRYVVSGLLPSTRYTFSFQTRLPPPSGYGEARQQVAETLSRLRATNIRATELAARSVRLIWEPARSDTLLSQKLSVSSDGINWQFNSEMEEGPLLQPGQTTFLVTALVPSTVYYFRVVSVFVGDEGAVESLSSPTMSTLCANPAKVVGLQVINITSDSAVLAWEALEGKEEVGALFVEYVVSLRQGTFTDSYVVREGTTNQFRNLLRNVAYHFTVTAKNEGGKFSEPSDEVTASTESATPAEMQAPTVTQTTTGLRVSWHFLSTNFETGGLHIQNYIVYTFREDWTSPPNGTMVGLVEQYLFTDLAPNYFYRFAVAARNAAGESAISQFSQQNISLETPLVPAPTALVFDRDDGAAIALSWDPPPLEANILQYRAYIKQLNDDFESDFDAGQIVNVPQTSLMFLYLPDASVFEFKVEALVQTGWTEMSAAVRAETSDDSQPTSLGVAVVDVTRDLCRLNATWTAPRSQVSQYRILYTVEGLDAVNAANTGSDRPFFMIEGCLPGGTYVMYVQSVFFDESASPISRSPEPLTVQGFPPIQMETLDLELGPDTSTEVLASWTIPQSAVELSPRSRISMFRLTITRVSTSTDVVYNISADQSEFLATGLGRGAQYQFSIQAVNVLGASPKRDRFITTDATVPSQVVNVSVVAGSESVTGDFLTLRWARPVSGNRDIIEDYRIFAYRLGDDYNPGTVVTVTTEPPIYTLTGLLGGLDYNFVIEAINSDGATGPGSEPLSFRTRSVTPRQITTLTLQAHADPDIGTGYRFNLGWEVPTDPQITGGTSLTGFMIRYTELSNCPDGCLDSSINCTLQRTNPPWNAQQIELGVVSMMTFTAVKGTTYIFEIAGTNNVGTGEYWPSCSQGDAACFGLSAVTCWNPTYTAPSKIPNFGAWAENEPGVTPVTSSSLQVRWGYPQNEYFDYDNKTINGGRSILNVEIQFVREADLNWPLDGYCPSRAGNDQRCFYQDPTVCSSCVVQCPRCLQSGTINAVEFVQKAIRIAEFGEYNADFYAFRIRFNNEADCGTVLGTDNTWVCTWSEFSDISYARVLRNAAYSNVLARPINPFSMGVLWFSPDLTTVAAATTGDQLLIYHGPTEASVRDRVDPAVLVNGPATATDTYQTTDISQLVPATTYYFVVLGYYTTVGPTVLPNSQSAVSRAIRTPVAIPAKIRNVTASIPASLEDRLAGGILLQWELLSAVCDVGTGVFLSDGSVDNCERGELGSLTSHKVWFTRSSETEWSTILVPGTVTVYLVTGLLKEVEYNFQVSALNSENEGEASNVVGEAPVETIPGAPPRPVTSSALPTSIRVSWTFPEDAGGQNVTIEPSFRLTIDPRRDGLPGNESVVYGSASEAILGDLQPNTLYLLYVSFAASTRIGYGVLSEPAYAYTTLLGPQNVRERALSNFSNARVLEWDFQGLQQGNLTITGYRVTYASDDGLVAGTTYCAGGQTFACTLNNLQLGKTFAITIAGTNDPRLETNWGRESEVLMIRTKETLPTVDGLTFSDTSAFSTTLDWNADGSGLPITELRIRIQEENEDYTAGIVVPDGQRPFTITGLGPNLNYHFIVVASNSQGFRESDPSEALLTAPAAVAVPMVVDVSSYFLVLSWTAWYGQNDIALYSVEGRRNDGLGSVGAWFSGGQIAGSTELTVSGVEANTQYDFRVFAGNSAGSSSPSDLIVVKTLPPAPALVRVTIVHPSSVVLRWDPSDGSDARYRIFRQRDDGSGWVDEASFEKTEGEGDSYEATGLVKGASYRFQVASFTESGLGALSVPSFPVSTLLSVPLPGPTPTATSPTTTSLLVSWEAVVSDVQTSGSPATGYALQSKSRSPTGTSDWTFVQELSSSQVSLTVENLESGTEYQFRVAIINTIGTGDYGDGSEVALTLPGPMPLPTQQAFLTTILLSWEPAPSVSVTSYRVYSRARIGGVWDPFAEQIVSADTFLAKFDVLLRDNQYSYKIAARNPSGWGADSDILFTRTSIAPDLWTLEDGIAQMAILDRTTSSTATLFWYGPAAGPEQDPIEVPPRSSLRGSAIGYQIYACRASTQVCDPGDEYLIACSSSFPYALAHTCDQQAVEYERSGLRKNTEYYFQLAVVNTGGPGPLSRPSEVFRTLASYPDVMATPTVTPLTTTSILVTWDAVTEWSARGGLDLTSYVVFNREEGGGYDDGEVIYEGTTFTYTGLASNSRFYFSIVAENEWCLNCPAVDEDCAFQICCETHSCTPKSVESLPISTIAGQMPPLRLLDATIFDLIVTWEALTGTVGNIFAYAVRFRDLDRASQTATGGFMHRQFTGGSRNTITIEDLEPNNRYEVIMSATNDVLYGQESEPAILMTRSLPITNLRIVYVRATEITLEWNAPPGRRLNTNAYNVSYRVATETEARLGFVVETLPVQWVQTPDRSTIFDIINLVPSTHFVFSVATLNEGGSSDFSPFTEPTLTMAEDLLGSCLLYSVVDSNISGTLLFQGSANGSTTVSGTLSGLTAGTQYALVEREYGRSVEYIPNFGVSRQLATIAGPSNVGEATSVTLDSAVGLDGPASTIARSVVVVPLTVAAGEVAFPLAQCEVGLAAPRSGSLFNAAQPSQHSRAFCTLVPVAGGGGAGTNIRGGFIVAPTDTGTRIRGRVCNTNASAGQLFSVRLHEYGDLLDGRAAGIGPVIADLGVVNIDSLGSGNFDLLDAAVSFSPTEANAVMGRSIVVYDGEDDEDASLTPMAACVVGAHEPSTESTTYMDVALPAPCTACTWTMGLQESIFTVAELFDNDWISVWSLNLGNPDKDQSGTSIYYAHPYTILQGEDVSSVKERFGMTDAMVARLNFNRTSFSAGETMCVAPQWDVAVDRSGARVCEDLSVSAALKGPDPLSVDDADSHLVE